MREFPWFDSWCNANSDFKVVMDCADTVSATKALFEAGTNGVTPVDMFDAWGEQRNPYTGSAWFKSWGMNASHPEFVVIDRDGFIRVHKAGWSNDTAMDAITPLVQQLCGDYVP